MADQGAIKDVPTSEEESRSTRSTSRRDMEARMAYYEQREKILMEEQIKKQEEFEREKQEFESRLAEKDQTIADLETEVSSLQNRLYEYEVKQSKILKDVGEMKKNQDSLARQRKEEEEKRKERELELKTEFELRHAQTERLLTLQFQSKMEEMWRNYLPHSEDKAPTDLVRLTSTPAQGAIKKAEKREFEHQERNDSETDSSSVIESMDSRSSDDEREATNVVPKRKPKKTKKQKKQQKKEEAIKKAEKKIQEEAKKPKRKHLSLDSLETQTESGEEVSQSSSKSDNPRIHRSILIREVAKIA